LKRVRAFSHEWSEDVAAAKGNEFKAYFLELHLPMGIYGLKYPTAASASKKVTNSSKASSNGTTLITISNAFLPKMQPAKNAAASFKETSTNTAKNPAASIKETAVNVGGSAESGMEKTKATLQKMVRY
ncbi:11 kDa late embryogenesis abundant protein-like protein, partial [Tanacetum coccineum]